MAKPENFIRAAFGAMILAVGCGEVQPRAIPDSVPIVSRGPKPITPTVLSEENEDFSLIFPRRLLNFKNTLFVTNWSGYNFIFKPQGLAYLFKECAINEFPGLVQVKLVKTHSWPYPGDITFGPREVIGISIAVDPLRDDFDSVLRGIVCVAVAENDRYWREGKRLSRDQMWDLVVQKAIFFQANNDTPAVVEFSP